MSKTEKRHLDSPAERELTKAYLKKAASTLNIMNAALEIGEPDWITTTAE